MNYTDKGLKKPLGTESALISDINDNMDLLDKLLPVSNSYSTLSDFPVASAENVGKKAIDLSTNTVYQSVKNSDNTYSWVSEAYKSQGGQVEVPLTPTKDTDASSKKYVDDTKTTLQTNINTVQTNLNTTNTNLTNHTNNKSNPHSVTKAQVGLGSVANTGDSATPTSGGTTKFTTGGAYTYLPANYTSTSATTATRTRISYHYGVILNSGSTAPNTTACPLGYTFETYG